ncbi:kinetochore-associated Ndc80 complex subunit ndc80 [Cryomyces antarcticus]|uniref:Kinetochore protein NDC80 n=1 Tax=Cryomyces antarcticus TaxID=329879 RepID=A0ABR0LZL7_9PEZI|nr:kinetochore-associated Ndc80 complex subunit ndc80 [Cryomyces antarcticus]KAK5017783.1 kinetochore-associated Ndc80 complex subunit ndc80 [Cryomyces antarcticus]KAK5256429.1 kinetochore-associated Ndc80 complex subunit ndc80 [Cryomyces antarcticus]
MSQDGGLFSVRRPRETLGGLSHNAASAIPMPSSAMKRSSSNSNLQQPPYTANQARSTSGSRMSLAPGRPSQPMFQRSSSGNNLADMGFSTVQRTSTTNMFNSTGGRKSYAPVSSTPASALQLQESTQRRSSVYSARPSAGMGPMGHQSFFAMAPPSNGIPNDPRRLKESSVRQQMGQELLEYLTQYNFEMEMKHSLTHKTMTSPTQKDFNQMFVWLYHRIDPAFRFQKAIDAEIPPLLKQLRYPFEKSITKSQLAAVGGNNWHTFLGLLHWMMQLAKMMEQYSAGAYDDACHDAGYDVGGDRIIFDFLSGSYKEWLSVEQEDDEEDDAARLIEPHVQAMAAKFDQANAGHLEQVKVLEAESKALQDQIDDLERSKPRVAKLDEQIKILEEDRVKFETYNNSMEAKVEKYQNRAKLLEDEIVKIEKELAEAQEEKTSLQNMVDKQGITVQDIDRMNTERERLQKGVETTSLRLEESKEKMMKKEIEASRKLEELEQAVDKYNSLGYQIGIIPPEAPNAKGQHYELVLTLNAGPDFRSSQRSGSQGPETDRLLADAGNGYQPHHLLNLELRGSVKSSIIALRKEISDRRNAALEADMNNHDLLDKTKEALDDKQAEVDGLGHRVRAAEEEFEKTREITTAQKMASDTQIERMEKELAKMRAGLGESVQLMEQREMNTNIEYEQLTLRAAALREELHTEIERMLENVCKFKLHIQTSLESYENFVAEEVEKECEAQEMPEDEMDVDA